MLQVAKSFFGEYPLSLAGCWISSAWYNSIHELLIFWSHLLFSIIIKKLHSFFFEFGKKEMSAPASYQLLLLWRKLMGILFAACTGCAELGGWWSWYRCRFPPNHLLWQWNEKDFGCGLTERSPGICHWTNGVVLQCRKFILFMTARISIANARIFASPLIENLIILLASGTSRPSRSITLMLIIAASFPLASMVVFDGLTTTSTGFARCFNFVSKLLPLL